MAIYTCGKCLFTFERRGEVDSCPDCGHSNVRLATEEEITEYKRNREETKHGGQPSET
ncbi:hypothetical protein FACS1894191_2910 [Clostridia bacterium]|nr:hypothetical protein FACS1894191_2910 [Clostridia bacterium]